MACALATLLVSLCMHTLQAAASNQTAGCTSFVRGRSSSEPGVMVGVTTCSGLLLTSVPASVADSTVVLLFDGNLLRYVNEGMLLRFSALEQLDLHSNQIEGVSLFAFESNKQLTNLSLSNNKLLLLPKGVFDRLSNLRSLNLSTNFLTVINNDTFAALRSLALLDLSRNTIETIEPAAFRNNNLLQELNLLGNRLQTLPGAMETFMPPALRTIRLGGNKWRCDCHLLWLKQYLLGSGARPPVYYDKESVECMYGTKAVQKQHLQNVAFTNMVCAPELYSPRELVRKTVVLGSNVLFQCAMFVIPKREVTWLKDGETVNTRTYYDSTRFVVDTSRDSNFSVSLNISRVEYGDAGQYACLYSNEAGSVSGNFTLEVLPVGARELTLDADSERVRKDDDGMIALVTSWFRNWSTMYIVLVATGAACIVIFVVSTVVYCVRTSNAAARNKRRKAGVKGGQSHSKYGQLEAEHDMMHIDAMSAQSAAKFNEDASSDNLLVNIGDQTLGRSLRLCNAKLQLNPCNNNELISDANGSPTLPPPPPYNPLADESGSHLDTLMAATPSLQRFGTQQRVQFQQDNHFCPVHGSKSGTLMPQMPGTVLGLNSHPPHQPTCPMFTLMVSPQGVSQNVSPYATVRRQPCPLHGASDELTTFPNSTFITHGSQTQLLAMAMDPQLTNHSQHTLTNGSVGNTYLKVSQVDDCVRDNMDDSSLSTFTSNLLMQPNEARKAPRSAGIDEEVESEALSTVV